MKTKLEILQQMIADAVAECDTLTYFGKDGAARGILNAAANVAFEDQNNLLQTKRDLQISTAEGENLVTLASRKDFTKKGPTKSSCIVLLNGPAGQTIPADTVIKSSINPRAQYKLLNDVVLGTNNPNIERPVTINSLGDIAIVESLETGSLTKVTAKELNSFLVPIAGVTVTNLAPSVGGKDEETDDELRERIIQEYDLFNQGTTNFYLSIARQADSNILKVLPKYNPSNGGIDLYLVKNSLASFSNAELQTIADYVYEKQRAMNRITCYNNTFKSIEIECYVRTRTGVDIDDIFTQIAEGAANYIDVQIMDFAEKVWYYRILDMLTDIDDIIDIDTNKLLINGERLDVQCRWNELPRFTSLSVTNQDSTKVENIQQKYLVI